MKQRIIFLLFAVFGLSLGSSADAQRMQGSETVLELDEFEVVEPTPVISQSVTPTKTEIKEPVNPFIAPPEVSYSLTMEASTDRLDFGILTPTSVTKRTITLSLTGTSEDFILYVFENHGLRNENGVFIPQTSCDTGTCSKHVASEWISTLSYGLGYSCLGSTCDRDFKQTAYRPFGNHLTSFSEGTLGIGFKREVTLPVQVNVPGTQESGSYENTLLLMAVPSI